MCCRKLSELSLELRAQGEIRTLTPKIVGKKYNFIKKLEVEFMFA